MSRKTTLYLADCDDGPPAAQGSITAADSMVSTPLRATGPAWSVSGERQCGLAVDSPTLSNRRGVRTGLLRAGHPTLDFCMQSLGNGGVPGVVGM